MKPANGSTPRIAGCKERLGDRSPIATWTPPSREEVAALPALPEPKSRGWTQADLWPTDSSVSHQHPPARVASPAPQTTGGPRKPDLPPGIEAGSAHSIIWEHSEEASQLLQTWLSKGEAAGAAAELKPAILALALGRDVASSVIRHLNLPQMEQIATSVAAVEEVTHQETQRVVEEFRQELESGLGARGGLDAARKILEEVASPRQVGEIIDRVSGTTSTGLKALRNVAPDQIAPYIGNEHPQTIALILSQLEPEQAAGILGLLPEDRQSDIAHRISTMGDITPNLIIELEESLKQSLMDILSGSCDVGGPKVLAEILNWTSSGVERTVLNQLDDQDAETAESVRNLMFTFNDIEKMNDRDIEKLVQELDGKDLATAMKGATEGLVQKFRNIMPEEAWDKLTQNMEDLGPMWRQDVEAVQLRIVQTVRQLEEKGEATIVRGFVPDFL